MRETVKSHIMKACVLSSCAALLGCSYSPRNKTKLTHATDTVTWAGFTTSPDTDVLLVMGDGTSGTLSASDIITRATSSSTATVDNVGTSWFNWSVDLTLPGDPKLWGVTAAHTIKAKMRTVYAAGLFDPNQRSPLVTFDFGSTTDNCIQSNSTGGGVQIVQNCHSSASPSGVVAITAPCGSKGEVCCPVSANFVTDPGSCDSGLQCAFSGGLGSCEVAPGGPCTTPADCAAPGSICKSNGTCGVPGPAGSSCGVVSDCVTGLLCKNSVCTAPAPSGAACSSTADCISGDTCIAGICSIPCPAGRACPVSSAKGACATGVTQCTATTKTCVQTVFPTTETCDGQDHNCNGTPNDIPATSCTNGASDSPTSQGCPVGRVHGRMACSGTRAVCTFKQGGNSPDYCTMNGPQCGDAQGESGPPCIPGATAANGQCGPTLCSPLKCWLPSDVNNSKAVCPPQG